MRIKFLAIIAGFLFMSIAISSCLNSDDNVIEMSSDATVHAFGLDTIYGKHYQFTIDQLNRIIYNPDSLPVGADTIIDRILIDTFSVRGWITAGINDSLFNINDSVDLRSAVNNEGMKFKVYAPDGVTIREYTLKINRHKLDPDSIQWFNMGSFNISGRKKSVLLNNAIYVYGDNGRAAKGTIGAKEAGSPISWEELHPNLTGTINSLLAGNGQLYASINQAVYSSSDGVNWTENVSLGQKALTLVAAFKDSLSAIVRESDGVLYFSKVNTKLDRWVKGDTVPTAKASVEFPLSDLVSTTFMSINNVEQSLVVGNQSATDKYTVPWMALYNRNGWADLANNAANSSCPKLENPSIIRYNNAFYIFGGKFDSFYKSSTGIAWYKADAKFWMPKEFKTKAETEHYSAVTDDNGFIWIIWNSDVWRGRLNKLGFKKQ